MVLTVAVAEWMVVLAKEAAERAVERVVAATEVAMAEAEPPAVQAEKEVASSCRRPMKRH